MKRMIQNYAFDKTAKTVTLLDYTSVDLEGLLLITNVTDGAIIYNFADPAAGATVADNVITLEYDTTAMDNSDKLQVYYDDPDYLPTSFDQQTDIKDLTEALLDAAEQISFLANVRGIASDLRVTLLSGALTSLATVTTVTTVSTVTSVSNIANMTAIGGLSTVPMLQNIQNQTAVQSNTNNVVQS